MEKYVDLSNLSNNLKAYHNNKIKPVIDDVESLNNDVIKINGAVTVTGSVLEKIYNNAANAKVTYTESDVVMETTLKSYIDYIAAKSGKIDKIKVNNEEQEITNKTVNISVPTKMSSLTNDCDFVSDSSYNHTDNNFTDSDKNKVHEHSNKAILDATTVAFTGHQDISGKVDAGVGCILELDESIDPNDIYPGDWVKLN